MKINVVGMSDSDQNVILQVVGPRSETFREVTLDVIEKISVRIHHDGLAADGTPIGTYSEGYMKVRTGDFDNSSRVSRGANKGKPKDTGVYNRGDKKGQARPKYNRGSDTKVILSLTRAMENNYVPIAGPSGWGVGFTNSDNYDKASWNDTRYGKTVYDLTDDELASALELAEKLITDELS